MGTLFNLVREQVSARDAAVAYGLHINRYGKARCPWHNDNRPSLSFKGNWCKCFACNNGGSAIDLTAQLYGLTPLEAANKLNDDFRIGADSNAAVRPVGPSKVEVRQMKRREFNAVWGMLCAQEQTAYKFLARCTPEDADSPVFKAFLAEFAIAQDMLNNLQGETEL